MASAKKIEIARRVKYRRNGMATKIKATEENA